ncbi:PREDICTED: zinc-finger homeodomain protein 11-like [Ipomoea nil]|uniref:zinc-finger homeodomain protein 11-like n=1 Tax=Ipomoea nil TaxID=35883 RepID=UPI000901F8F5|nr:PREDICTED: zinc-finger homeodomain protein 11-like [Ipomoea nil]
MDLTTSPTTKTPDSENDTPPQPRLKPLSFVNGAAAAHRKLAPPPPVVYKECLKNHAASMGGHALDGCGEFMPAPDATPADPTSLKCAACGCHRNFHRREPPDDYSISSPHFIDFRHPFRRRSSPSPSPPPPPPPQHMLLALTTPPEDSFHHNHHLTPVTPTAVKTENTAGRKRFRTKFTQEQKEKMHNFSEKLGWKLQKSDEVSVERFCNEIGVSRGVLKVWMHNNKNTLGKKDNVSNGGFNVINGGGTIKNDGVDNNNNSNSSNDHNASSSHCRDDDQNICGGDLNLHISAPTNI